MWVEQNGETWRIRDRRNGRKVTLEEGWPTKTMASARLVRLQVEEMDGTSIVPQGGQITVRQVVDEWWPEYSATLKPTARHSEGGRVRNHIVALLGDVALESVDVRAWVADLVAGNGPAMDIGRGRKRKRKALAAKTVHNCHGVLFMIMDYAVEHRYIRTNPCAGRRKKYLPRRERKEMRFLTDPEIKRLLLATPPHWRPLVFLLVSTGLRWGEAIGLRVGRVDLLAKKPHLMVVEHLHELSDGSLIFTDPKTKRSRRTVTFPVKVALMLTALVAGRERDESLFSAPRGGLVRTRNFRRGWLVWTKEAGLTGLRVHDLRHTHAAILLSGHGLSLSAISRRLGHSSIAVTDQLYGHLREEADPGVMAAIEAALADISAEDLMDEVGDEGVDEVIDLGATLGATEPVKDLTEPIATDETAGRKA